MVDRYATCLLLTGLALAGCGSHSETGVHVQLAVPATLDPFDHVTVIATVNGNQHAVACLYIDQKPFAVDRSDAAASEGDPCADQMLDVLEVPTVDAWDFAHTPRSIDIVVPDGVSASVEAFAAFGGVVVAKSAAQTATGGSPFAEVTASLTAINPLSACDATLVAGTAGVIRAPANGSATEETKANCLAAVAASPTCVSGPAQYTAALHCVAGAAGAATSVLYNTSELVADCKTASDDGTTVYELASPGLERQACIDVTFQLHFARCADGSTDLTTCPLTSDCVVPHTAIIDEHVGAIANGATTTLDLGCLPPTVYPLTVGTVTITASSSVTFHQAADTTGNGTGCALFLTGATYTTSDSVSGCRQ